MDHPGQQDRAGTPAVAEAAVDEARSVSNRFSKTSRSNRHLDRDRHCHREYGVIDALAKDSST